MRDLYLNDKTKEIQRNDYFKCHIVVHYAVKQRAEIEMGTWW